MKCDCPPHAPQLPVFCCKMWTEETTQDSSRRVGSSGPRSGQVRGQQLCQTQVGHGEAAANGDSVAASPPRLHSALPPTITICWTVFDSVTLHQSLSLQPVHGLCKTHLSSLLLCQHTLSACLFPAMNYCQSNCLLLRVCPCKQVNGLE